MTSSARPLAILLPVLLLLGALGWWLWGGLESNKPQFPGPDGPKPPIEAGEGEFGPETTPDSGLGDLTSDLGPQREDQLSSSAQVLPADSGSDAIPVQVVDERGRPFAGVKFAVWKRDSSPMGGRTRPPKADEPVAIGTADEEGRFSIPGAILPEAMGRMAVQMGFVDLELMLRHPELADARPSSDLPNRGEWIVRLPRNLKTSAGQVLTPQGQPAAMAELHVDGILKGWTSPEGYFRLPRSEKEPPSQLRILHPTGGLDVSLAREEHGQLRLDSGLGISGRVLDLRGVPVENVRLHLMRRIEPGDTIGPYHPVGMVTEQDGAFAFHGLPPGMYSVSAFMGEANGPLPLNIPLQQHGERVLALRAGDLGVRLEMATKVLYLDLQWPSETSSRPLWISTGLVAPNSLNPFLHSRFRLPPDQVYMVWPGEIPAAGLDLEWRVNAEGYVPLTLPVQLTQEVQILRSPATMNRLDGVGSLRLDLLMPPEGRGWQLEYRLEPLEGQVLPEEYLRLALPDIEGRRQSNLLLDLPEGSYRVVLGDAGAKAFGPPAMSFVGDPIVEVKAGMLQHAQLSLEALNPAPSIPSDH